MPLAGFGAGIADRLGVRTAGFVGAAALDAAGELGTALDAGLGEVAGESPTGGLLEPRGETKGGRATRVGADLKPSKTTMPVTVPSVANIARFMLATCTS